jgi:hypothetical protein
MRRAVVAASRVMRVVLSSFFLALVLTACGDKTPPAPIPALPPIERAAIISPRRIASSAAFDLVAVPRGALFVWGQPTRMGGGVRAAKLDAMGTVERPDIVVFAPTLSPTGTSAERIAPDALEISVASAGGRVGVVWVAREQTVLTIEAALGDLNADAFSPRRVLGSTSRLETGGRGHVAAAVAPDGRAFVLVRAQDRPCGDGTGPCGAFNVYALRAEGASDNGPGLLVPGPCERAAVGMGFAQGRFHYAVCGTQNSQRGTTVYSIQPDAQYARADLVLPGCSPLGFFVAHDELVIPAACEGGRAGVRLSRDGGGMRSLSLDGASVRCEGTMPVISTPGAPAMSMRLDQPISGIEAMLPARVAPAGSRAVFTGRSVLVASSLGGEVTVHRFECEGGDLVRTDVR